MTTAIAEIADRINRFGADLLAARLAAGMTRTAFAAAVGVSQQAVYSWERKGVIPSPARMMKIIAVLKPPGGKNQ